MTLFEKQAIIKIQNTLLKINDGVSVFFNVVQYEKLGLVKSTKNWGKDSSGNKVVINHTFYLTEKGKRVAFSII